MELLKVVIAFVMDQIVSLKAELSDVKGKLSNALASNIADAKTIADAQSAAASAKDEADTTKADAEAFKQKLIEEDSDVTRIAQGLADHAGYVDPAVAASTTAPPDPSVTVSPVTPPDPSVTVSPI